MNGDMQPASLQQSSLLGGSSLAIGHEDGSSTHRLSSKRGDSHTHHAQASLQGFRALGATRSAHPRRGRTRRLPARKKRGAFGSCCVDRRLALLCGFILVHATRAQSPCANGEDAGAAKPLADDLMSRFLSRQGVGGLIDVGTAAQQQEVLDLMMQS